MATTPNIGLYKPTRDDYISVQRDLSNNYELIDSAIGQNNAVINDMDIVVNGNTASVNVTKGQFVTVRNSTITGITDGIYMVKNNVASGTAFTSSNLESVTGGVLNSLIDRFIPKNVTDDCTWNYGFSYPVKEVFDYGSFYLVSISATSSAFTNGAVIVTLPENARITQYMTGTVVLADLTPTGQTCMATSVINSKDITVHISGASLTGYIVLSLFVLKQE